MLFKSISSIIPKREYTSLTDEISMLKLQRSEKNPILLPSKLPWEDMLVFNPGVIMVEDSVYLIYRAMGKTDLYSRLGLATSRNGITFKIRRSIYRLQG